MAYSKTKGDVYWYIPKKKKPIAYSTQAVSDTICVIADNNGGDLEKAYDAITYDMEAKEIIKKYLDAGYKYIYPNSYKRGFILK